jgi:hypothetical protein
MYVVRRWWRTLHLSLSILEEQASLENKMKYTTKTAPADDI